MLALCQDNLKRLLADVQNLLKHSVDPRVTIQMRGGMDASYATGDATQIEQVMLNLCLNARDSLPADKGVIEIAVENVTHRMPSKSAESNEAADFVMLVVRDNVIVQQSKLPFIFWSVQDLTAESLRCE